MGVGFDDLKIVPGVAFGLSSDVRLFTFNKTNRGKSPPLFGRVFGPLAWPLRYPLCSSGGLPLRRRFVPIMSIARWPLVAVATVLQYNDTNLL